MAFVCVYVTFPDEKTARKICLDLVEKRIIACANIFPIKSIFRWKGKIEDSSEIASVLKGRDYDLIKKEVEARHPYECPCIMRIPVDANLCYEAWIRESSTSQPSKR